MSGNHPGASNAAEVRVPAILFCIVTPFFVGLRVWSRLSVSNGLGVDDWTILTSLVIILSIIIITTNAKL